jgi:hypothetical protein
MTARDRAANACRESFNLYDEDYRGGQTTLVPASNRNSIRRRRRTTLCKRNNFEKAAPMISKCVSGA